MTAFLPMLSEACSTAGISRLQNDADSMTPAAKPVRAFCSECFIPFFINRTIMAPKAVPAKGTISPIIIFISISLSPPDDFLTGIRISKSQLSSVSLFQTPSL